MKTLTKLKPFAGIRASGAALAAGLFVTGCVSPVAGPSGQYAQPIGNAPVTANPTPYSEGLVCMGHYARTSGYRAPRIAVGRILDYTGKADIEGGRRVTQGASLMAISAFAKSGARLVERFDTSVSELELKYANNKLIGDETPDTFRKITAGSIPGSDYYLVGGITELNYNIRSVGAEAFIGDVDPTDPKGSIGAKLYVINVGLDLRLVETESLEVVDVISYQKQIIGREISLGIFDFANGNVFDVGVGGRAQEPIQLAVRSVIERAVLEMMANLYAVPTGDVCAQSDGVVSTNNVTGDFRPVAPLEAYNGPARQDVAAWQDPRDTALRGRN
ncbi:holdfast anchoring protein HfaB [Henriciella aquimarina]|uniref:holdfast anchoring protein HfaB n=1 Tax=Henriciella aquimarina TaxID=545261 RepID=UPI0009FE2D27|nr:holdfast anchoring protein HfaB [Henriciella aquimarina]